MTGNLLNRALHFAALFGVLLLSIHPALCGNSRGKAPQRHHRHRRFPHWPVIPSHRPAAAWLSPDSPLAADEFSGEHPGRSGLHRTDPHPYARHQPAHQKSGLRGSAYTYPGGRYCGNQLLGKLADQPRLRQHYSDRAQLWQHTNPLLSRPKAQSGSEKNHPDQPGPATQQAASKYKKPSHQVKQANTSEQALERFTLSYCNNTYVAPPAAYLSYVTNDQQTRPWISSAKPWCPWKSSWVRPIRPWSLSGLKKSELVAYLLLS